MYDVIRIEIETRNLDRRDESIDRDEHLGERRKGRTRLVLNRRDLDRE